MGSKVTALGWLALAAGLAILVWTQVSPTEIKVQGLSDLFKAPAMWGFLLAATGIGLLQRRPHPSAPPSTPEAPSPPPSVSIAVLAIEIDVGKNREIIARLKSDALDTRLFMHEMVRVMVRLNPVNQQIYEFNKILEDLTEETQQREKPAIVERAIEAVDLSSALATVDELLDTVGEFAAGLVAGQVSDITNSWPGSCSAITHPWMKDPERESDRIRQRLLTAVRTHRNDLALIVRHFEQLREFLPRYQALMNRSGLWNYVVGFAAGFFGGAVGVIGAEIWEEWTEKSDGDFIESFVSALQQFQTASLEYTQKTEAEVEKVISTFSRDLKEFQDAEIEALEAICKTTDLSPVFQILHYPAPDPDGSDEGGDSQEFFEAVLSNLRDDGLSLESERNLREMLGLD